MLCFPIQGEKIGWQYLQGQTIEAMRVDVEGALTTVETRQDVGVQEELVLEEVKMDEVLEDLTLADVDDIFSDRSPEQLLQKLPSITCESYNTRLNHIELTPCDTTLKS